MTPEALNDEVHVWCSFPEAAGDVALLLKLEALLGAEERARRQRLHHERDRRLFLVAHALLRRSLSRYGGVPPGDWQFTTGPHGRPEIARPRAEPPLRFNLSHTPGLVACVVARDLDVGIDVEGPRRLHNLPGLARRTLAPEELAELSALPADARPDRFLTAWTLKEAYSKACGKGLSLPLRDAWFTLGGAGVVRARFAPRLGDREGDWQFLVSRLTSGHRLAVAVRRGGGCDRVILVRTDDFGDLRDREGAGLRGGESG